MEPGPDPDPRSRRRLAVAGLGIGLLLAWGLWSLGPYVLAEHRRLEPGKVALLWAGDAVAVAWFLQVLVAHVVVGEPLRSGRRRIVLVAVTLGLGALLDGGLVGYQFASERTGYDRGVRTVGEVVSVRRREAVTTVGHRFRVRFDVEGEVHEADVGIHLRRTGAPPPGLAPELVELLRRGETPSTLAIRHAPAWPARAWVEGLPDVDENRFAWLSLGVLVLQILAYALFVGGIATFRGSLPGGGDPWWTHLHPLVPLACEAVLFAVFGTVDVIMGWR